MAHTTTNLPEHLKYTKEHEWVELTEHSATIGITHYAQESLGDIVFVELPQIGDTVKMNAELSVVESVKAASEVYAPISGKIIAINEALAQNPALLNEHPYTEGWLVKIEPSDLKELEEVMNAEAYAAHLAQNA